ncbi:MAG TPA: 50S ribosomal protein L30e [candidate division Zixibacteria bacterium]|nr:50S ribosomal protein L30e [candidate division Zixibacteria bacterium]
MSYDLNREIQIIARTGRRDYGISRAVKVAKLGRAQLFILSNNTIAEKRDQIEHYAKLANIPIVNYNGTGYDLGALCGRGHVVSVISVYDPGDSKILRHLKK